MIPLGVPLFILGLFIGSFFAAYSYRIPRGISIVRGRSFCPNCKHQIAWYDNIPLLSFLLLRGKCRNCHKKISPRYPVIEFGTGVAFLAAGYLAPVGLGLLFWLIIFSILILIFVTDFERQLIPDSLVFFGIVIFMFYSFYIDSPLLYGSLSAGFLAALLLLGIHLATKGKGMGLGDVKLAVLGGMICGFDHVFVWLLLSFLTGGIVGIILVLAKAAGLKDRIAFGPFLITGLVLTLFYGNSVLKFIGF